MENERSLLSLSDDDLLGRLAALLRGSRRFESDLVAHIGEVDRRHLYAREGSPSMFAYCVEVLHLSEAEAYLRIAAARAAREQPVILSMLADGRLHLSGIAKLAPHLTVENADALLGRASYKTKRQIEELLAELAPRPDVPAVVRKLPERTPIRTAGVPTRTEAVPTDTEAVPTGTEGVPTPTGGVSFESGPQRVVVQLRPDGVASSNSSASIQPLAPSRYKVEFTASRDMRDKLERLRALMRSEVPDGDLGAILERAVTEKLERLEAKRFGKTRSPHKKLAKTATSPVSRHVPAAVRRAVWKRDGGRCCFVDARGRRCSERNRLEYHHRHPFGLGGDQSQDNICLMCSAHNRYLAELDYGRKAMSQYGRIEPRSGSSTSARASTIT